MGQLKAIQNKLNKIRKDSIKNYILIILIILYGIFIVYNYKIKNENNMLKESISNLEESYSKVYLELNSLTYNTFKEKVKNKDRFYVYVGRPNCSDCNNFEDVLIELLNKYDVMDSVYYLNIANLINNEKELEELRNKYNLMYTPSFVEFSEGKLKTKVEWTPENGIIKEEVESWIKKIEK